MHQGVQLLERFAQDDRIRIHDPQRDLQIKIVRNLPEGNEFLGYVDAIGELPLHAVVTTGPAVDPAGLTAPDNVELHRFIPHADVMPTVSLVVGHGGHSTTMLALAHDLPLVILPVNPAFDQPIIGRRIAELGAGVTLPPTSSAAEIRAAIERAHVTPSIQTEAARLGAAIRATHGTSAAAALLESLVVAAVR